MLENNDLTISTEDAEKEFDRFIKLNEIDINEDDDDEWRCYQKARKIIIKRIQEGYMKFDECGIPTYIPHDSASESKEPLTFNVRIRAGLQSTASIRKINMKNCNQALALMCNTNKTIIGELAGVDFTTCKSMFFFLMKRNSSQ